MNFTPRCWSACNLLWSSLGALSVAAMLALTPTGVHVARAADPAPLVPEAIGPSSVDPALAAGRQPTQAVAPPLCRAGSPQASASRERARLRQEMLRVQQEIARRAATESDSVRSARDGIVLNGRGYRYGRAGR